MVVDISPRGSGKTTRLVEALINYLDENEGSSAILIAPTDAGRKHIYNMVVDKCGDPCSRRTITSYKMLPNGGKTSKQFVDEYLHIGSERLVLDEEAYYNSSGIFRNELQEDIWLTYKKLHALKPKVLLKKHRL